MRIGKPLATSHPPLGNRNGKGRRRFALVAGGLSLAALVVAPSAMAQPARPRPARTTSGLTPQGLVPFKAMERGSLCHAGTYSPFTIRWRQHSQVRAARGVWPHPCLAWRTYVLTTGGLLVSDDWGKTFNAVPDAGKAGRIGAIEFVPDSPEAFYLIGEGKGLWATADGGKTLTAVASKTTGLADDRVAQLVLYGADPTSSTLLVGYGESATGLSVSYDAGKAWSVQYPDLFVHRIVSGGPGTAWLYLIAAKKDEPEVRCVYRARALGDRLTEVARDLPATEGAVSLLAAEFNARPVYLAAADKGVQWGLEQYDSNRLHVQPKFAPIPNPPVADRFLSLGTTYGPNADSELVYLYEPEKLGLSLAMRQKKNFTAAPGKNPDPLFLENFRQYSEGLFTGSFVKEGSTLRPNANGEMFYAVINDVLYAGRRVQAGLDVSEVAVRPARCAYGRPGAAAAFGKLNQSIAEFDRSVSAAAAAKDLVGLYDACKAAVPVDAITITAKVAGDDAPAFVSVDLSRLAYPPDRTCRVPMFDDGLHDDGAAGDGVYGLTVPLVFDQFRSDGGDWRRAIPGPAALTVSAAGGAEAGYVSGGVGLFGIFFSRPDNRTFWQADALRDWANAQGLEQAPVVDDSQPHGDKLFQRSLMFRVKDKPWMVPLLGASYNNRENVLGYHALSFWIRSDRNTDKDLTLNLRDAIEDARPKEGVGLSLIKDGLVAGGAIDPTWRRVVVPLARALGGQPLIPTSINAVLLRGDGTAEQSLWISDVTLYLTPKDLEDALKAKASH